MKMKFIFLLLLISNLCTAQYIGVRARYTETRLVDDSPNPPKRENRLVLSFYTVTFNGTGNDFTPVVLSNYDIWVYKEGLQFGNPMGGVLDSTGNNYPGYAWPAPKVVSYYNTFGLNYIDCSPYLATHYVVNGQELDCGFITVSYWDMDYGTMLPFEAFPAPNICLPWYDFIHPYYFLPGNVNFSTETVFPMPPYNFYNFYCGGPLQLVRRGLLSFDSTSGGVVLPVRFAHVKGTIDPSNKATISWSNLTESDILQYEVERSADGATFHTIATVLPNQNNGGRADYTFMSLQPDLKDYYRVKATETTGASFYSNIVTLSKTKKPKVFIVNPNPVTHGQFTFRLTNAEQGRYVFSIINQQGQQIKQKIFTHTGGDISQQVEITGIPPGAYQLVLWSATERYSQKIVNVY